MTLTPPSSQKAGERPISFIIEANGKLDEVKLFIRPEDLAITFPSRTTVNQTLGGAWVDSFGEGLETINVSGITGWRTADGMDGMGRIATMKNKVYSGWHSERAKAIAEGRDPNQIKLRYVDTLNRYSRVVTPNVFEMRRSKSQPLLVKYRISMTVVGKSTFTLPATGGADASGFGLSSLLGSIRKIVDAIKSVKKFIDTRILGPVRAFMSLTGQILTAVHSIISAGQEVVSSLINVARGITQVGLNIFRTFAAVASIPSQVKAALMEVAGAYSNAFCVLNNALKQTPTYEDYNPLYGASNCSSTSGGRPPSVYAGLNPFNSVVPVATTVVGVTPQANQALKGLASRDVVLAPLPIPAVGGLLTDINTGVIVR